MCHNYLYFYSHRVQPQHKNKAYKAYTLLYKLSNYKLQNKSIIDNQGKIKSDGKKGKHQIYNLTCY